MEDGGERREEKVQSSIDISLLQLNRHEAMSKSISSLLSYPESCYFSLLMTAITIGR